MKRKWLSLFLALLLMITAILPVSAQETEMEIQDEYFSDTLLADTTIQGEITYINGNIMRIYGTNRYETSLAIAECLRNRLGKARYDAIVVASGTNFPDALSGAYLAIQKQAPILLVNKNYVDKVNLYIQYCLNPGGTVYLLGGESAVPNTVGSGIGGINVKRLGGANRYETNLAILNEAGTAGKNILICTGRGFADSLSASAAGIPILLVKDKLNDAQKRLLAGNNGTKFIIGGESAVSAEIAAELQAYGQVVRIGGQNRYETSALVAEGIRIYPEGTMVAYAQNFPDGLCGGPLAYYLGVPMVLTANGKEAMAKLYVDYYQVKYGFILGGSGLISDQTAINIFGGSAQNPEPEATEPKPTEPKPTEPKPTEPKPTEPKPTYPVHKPSQSSNSVIDIVTDIFGRPQNQEYIEDRYETRYTYSVSSEPKDAFDELQSTMESLGLNVYRHSYSSNGGRKEVAVKAEGGTPVHAIWYKNSGEVVITINWEYVRKAGIFDTADIPAEPEQKPASPNPGDKVRCNVCFGSGDCPKCGGSGEVTKWVSGTVNDYVTQTCNRCWGTKKCDSCKNGWVDP